VKVADEVAEFLARHGIEHVFGIVGAGNAQLFDAITRLGKTEIVCVHHEQSATMAMQTYYRTRGKVSAAIVTTGGGSTNALTGVVGAWADSIPGLVISGNENSRFTTAENPLRMWGVQGYDSSAAVEKVTKRAVRVTDPAGVVAELERSYALCSEGRPGPCWVDIPMNVQSAPAVDAPVEVRAPSAPEAVDARSVADMLRGAERPLLWLGHGIRLAGAVDRIERLLDVTGAAALVSWAGVDMVASEHPQVIGRAGTYGQRAANLALQTCDALVCIGTRMALPQIGYDVNELARGARIAVVDVDPAEAHKLGDRVELPVVADAGAFISALIDELRDDPPGRPEAWLRRCRELRTRYPWVGPEHDDSDGYPNSYRFLDRLSDHLADDEVVVTDMGTALLSGHQVMRFRSGQRMMTSTGLGEMGFGLPGAIGASFARDRGRVLCLNCDGGMMMNLQELQTIAHHRLPIRIVVFNNDGYLMIKHTQKALFEGRYSGTHPTSGLSCPDFSAVAAAFGMPSFQVRDWNDFDGVIPEFMAGDGPAICEVFTHPEQFFHPKLSVATQPDGTLLSPPLEDLSPFLPRDELEAAMDSVGLHDKSRLIEVS
jgi:acetolactate synthase-1/2/3 large subunit